MNELLISRFFDDKSCWQHVLKVIARSFISVSLFAALVERSAYLIRKLDDNNASFGRRRLFKSKPVKSREINATSFVWQSKIKIKSQSNDPKPVDYSVAFQMHSETTDWRRLNRVRKRTHVSICVGLSASMLRIKPWLCMAERCDTIEKCRKSNRWETSWNCSNDEGQIFLVIVLPLLLSNCSLCRHVNNFFSSSFGIGVLNFPVLRIVYDFVFPKEDSIQQNKMK